jgi:F0F1-type ATP synthase membrane subunit b/b'
MAEARKIAAKIVDEGRAAIEAEVKATRLDLGRSSAVLARDIATRVLGREVN